MPTSMSESPSAHREGLWRAVALHLLCLVALLTLPSALLGKALWKLPEDRAIVAFGLGYLVSAALVIALGRARPATRAELLSALALGDSVPLLYLALSTEKIPRSLLLGELALGALLLGGTSLLRAAPRALAGAAVLLAGVGLASQMVHRRPPPPAPPRPSTAVSYLGSQVYDLKITRYRNRTKKLEVSGGGLTLFGEGYLLAIGDGTLYVVSRKGEEQALSIEPYPYQVPINAADFAAAVGTKVSRAYFRVADVLSQSIDDRLRIYATHHFWKSEQRCFVLRVSMLEGPRGEVLAGRPGLGWKTLYEASPCLPVEIPGRGAYFQGLETGGRLAQVSPSELLVSIGDNGFDGVNTPRAMAQDPASSYGKTVLIDLKEGSGQIYSLGHRNPQGLFADRGGQVWSVEHGPQGGDELNLIERGANYGWPIRTYGVDYGVHNWPLDPVPGSHAGPGITLPYFSWVPSLAVSSVMVLHSPLFPLWEGDLLIGTLKGGSIYRVRVRERRVVMMERIQIGERIRDIEQGHEGELLLWVDTGSVIVIRPTMESEMGGASLFERCVGCHVSWDGTKHRIGPDLFKIVGQPVASKKGFAYSPELQAYGGVWTRARLDAFLADPRGAVPGTTMMYGGVKDASSRARLLDFLESGAVAEPPEKVEEDD